MTEEEKLIVHLKRQEEFWIREIEKDEFNSDHTKGYAQGCYNIISELIENIECGVI